MRYLLTTLTLLLLSAALASGSLFLPFLNALDGNQDAMSLIESNLTHAEGEQELDLLKRQNSVGGCPSQYSSCQNLGAPQLCCANNAVCSADSAGYVACCPRGAACTGTITGVITSGTIPPGGTSVSTSNGLTTTATTTTAQQGTSTSNGMVIASSTATTTSNGGFIISGTSTVASPASAPRRMDVPVIMQIFAGLFSLMRLL
ncbi:hypothetical protein K461DRAFT_266152 [Myriangium duriaei CBS 260.36]|uniref:Granulins domain-containing protein n=1 Tax=Myriangium duriaei CBS 260.36 TaxID=1168546 RepID=A0A9P4MPL2_9PEZI|nr:hypothetical protein K461DRAFT_266152 [Myriangium duriaei CBS 260.36]